MTTLRAFALLLASYATTAYGLTPAEIADQHLLDEMRVRLSKGPACDCKCLIAAKTLWQARKVLRERAPTLAKIDELGKSIDADLEANYCNTTGSGNGRARGNATGGNSFAGGGGGLGGGGVTDMRLPDIYVAAGKLDAPSQKKFYDQLPATAQLEWRKWASSNKAVAEKLYGEDLEKQLLASGTPIIARTEKIEELDLDALTEAWKQLQRENQADPYLIRSDDASEKLLQKYKLKLDGLDLKSLGGSSSPPE